MSEALRSIINNVLVNEFDDFCETFHGGLPIQVGCERFEKILSNPENRHPYIDAMVLRRALGGGEQVVVKTISKEEIVSLADHILEAQDEGSELAMRAILMQWFQTSDFKIGG